MLLLSNPAICRPAGLCRCVIHACCHRYYNTDISLRRYMISCWTYSHNDQIADTNPSKRWNGEFWAFRICIGFVQRDFVLWVFVCSVNFSLFSGYHAEGYYAPPVSLFPATTPRATTPHRYPTSYHAQGYHALTTTARLSRLCIFPGYDAIV